MSQRLYLPFQQVFSNVGIIGAGYKVYTYETGTSTPKATYSDVALTVPNTNPVVANSAGRFGNIYGERSALYKFVLTDASDAIIETRDPVDPESSTIVIFDPIPAAFWGTTAGTSSAYTLDSLVDISSVGYTDTQVFMLAFHVACAANPTINIDDLGALNLKRYDLSYAKTALIANDVLPGRYWATNDGVDIIILDIVRQASETILGISEIATQDEVNAGTDDERFITPLKLKTSVYNSKELITTATASASTSIDFTNLSSTFSRYIAEFINILPATDNVYLIGRFSVNNGSSFIATNYVGGKAWGSPADNPTGNTSNTTGIDITGNSAGITVDNAATNGINGYFELDNPSSASAYKSGRFFVSYDNDSGNYSYSIGNGRYEGATTAVNALRFLFNSGNIASGTIKLYGVK